VKVALEFYRNPSSSAFVYGVLRNVSQRARSIRRKRLNASGHCFSQANSCTLLPVDPRRDRAQRDDRRTEGRELERVSRPSSFRSVLFFGVRNQLSVVGLTPCITSIVAGRQRYPRASSPANRRAGVVRRRQSRTSAPGGQRHIPWDRRSLHERLQTSNLS
jgi:hypothetical protein